MKIRSLRWWIAGVLFAASVLNYLDRTALSVASKQIMAELSLNEAQYGWINGCFMAAYAASYGFGGILVDRLGTRRSVTLSLAWWSLANTAHAFARSFGSLVVFRFALGLGEAAFYPAQIRATAEWFSARDRSKPIGLVLAGATLGAIIAPILVGTAMRHPGLGWRWAFATTGIAGLLLVPFWLLLYRRPEEHPRVCDAERDYLAGIDDRSKTAEEAAPWSPAEVAGTPQGIILIIARGLTDASWFLLLFWLLLYFQKVRHFTPQDVAAYGWLPFAAADLGALFGGWFSSQLIARGGSVLAVRRACMLGFPMLLPASLVGYFIPDGHPALALAFFCVATFGHMAWGTNQLTLHSDLFPPSCVATIMGMSGAAGALASVAVQPLGGWLVVHTHHYLPIFATTAVLHPLAGLFVFFSLRNLGPVRRRQVATVEGGV